MMIAIVETIIMMFMICLGMFECHLCYRHRSPVICPTPLVRVDGKLGRNNAPVARIHVRIPELRKLAGLAA